MRKKSTWLVRFSENGEEYIGSLSVWARSFKRDPNNDRAFVADGVRIEIDEYITDVEKLPGASVPLPHTTNWTSGQKHSLR